MSRNDFNEDQLIASWPHTKNVELEFQKRGFSVYSPPVSIADQNNPDTVFVGFAEDCDFTVSKPNTKRQSQVIMNKSCMALSGLNHDNPIESFQSLDLPTYNGEKVLPIDPTWRHKFWMHCRKEDMKDWYSERVWCVSDPDVSTIFFFEGKDIIDLDIQIPYKSHLKWNFMPVNEDTTYWSGGYLPYRVTPWKMN